MKLLPALPWYSISLGPTLGYSFKAVPAELGVSSVFVAVDTELWNGGGCMGTILTLLSILSSSIVYFVSSNYHKGDAYSLMMRWSVRQSCGGGRKSKNSFRWQEKKVTSPDNIIKSIWLLDTSCLWPCITAKNVVKKPKNVLSELEGLAGRIWQRF